MEAEYIRSFNDKTRYRSLDPNNTYWAKDESRFGLKMLKNMGWSEGRGLGANEDGNLTHVSIKKKFSNSGIGEENNSGDNWLKGAFEFGNLLKRLNTDNNAAAPEVTEKKTVTNNSKRRHLYQKRLASRDASGYSKEDMAQILGTDQLQPQEKVEEEETWSESEDEDMPFLKKTTMSVTDYFMKKGEANLTDSEDESENTNGKRTVELRMEEFSSTGLGYSVKVGKKRTRKETGISEEEEIPSKIIKETLETTIEEKKHKKSKSKKIGKEKKLKEKKSKDKKSKKSKTKESSSSSKKEKRKSKKSKKEKSKK